MSSSENVKWLTYHELAEALSIKPDSARSLVKRHKWHRRAGNDGLARIGVPEDYLTAPRSAPEDAPLDDPQGAPEDAPPGVREVIEVLTNHISRLERELEAVRAAHEVDRERAADRDAVAAQVDALRSTIEAMEASLAVERERRADVEADRDRWHETATRVPAPVPHRPWWRRLAG